MAHVRATLPDTDFRRLDMARCLRDAPRNMRELLVTRGAIAAMLVACATPMPTDDDPSLDDGKADGSAPTLKGVLGWAGPQDVALTTDDGARATYVYLTF